MREWVLQRYQVYGRVCLIIAISISPLVFYRRTVDAFNLAKITVLWVFGVLALVTWLSWSMERGVWPPLSRIIYAAAAFLGVCGLATVFSQNSLVSLIGLYHRYGGLIPFILYAVIMVLIVGLYWERPDDLKEIARASGIASILMAGYVLIQAAGLDWIRWATPDGELPSFPVGTMGNSNFAGGYLGIAVPFSLYLALTAKHTISKVLLTAFVGLDLLALWFTQTRGGMIAAGAGLVTMAFVYRDRLPRWARAAVVSAVMLAVVTAILVLWHPGSKRPPEPLARSTTLRTDTFTIRTHYWDAAWRVFKDHPLLGTGPETYFVNYPRYRSAADGARLGSILTDKPHNIYLEYAANAGVLGVGAYLLLVSLGGWYGYIGARRREGHERLLATTFLGVLAGYLAQGFFSIDVPPLALMGWVALGGITAAVDPKMAAARDRRLAEREQKGRPGLRKNNRPSPAQEEFPVRHGFPLWPVHAVLAMIAAGLLAVGTRPFLADIKAQNAQILQNARAPSNVVAANYQQAIKLHPLEPTYRVLAGFFSERQASSTGSRVEKRRLFLQALARYREAQRLQPGNIFYLMNSARTYATWGETLDAKRFAEADRLWARIVADDPADYSVHVEYALMLNSWGNATNSREIRLRSAQELKEVIRIRPDYADAWVNLGKLYRALGESEKAEAALKQALTIEPTNQEARQLLASPS